MNILTASHNKLTQRKPGLASHSTRCSNEKQRGTVQQYA